MQQRPQARLEMETLQFMVGILIPKPHQVLGGICSRNWQIHLGGYHSAAAQQWT